MNSEITRFNRILNIDLPKGKSAFLWGARNTGKSAYLRANYPNSVHYDLLGTNLYLQLIKAPYVIREEVLALSPEQLASPIIIDEIQKVALPTY